MVDSCSSTWVEALISEKYFNCCLIHEDAKKNEKNMFCVDCCEAICNHCLLLHNSHRLLQIRRYVYQEVIKVGDAEKLMDCSYVQAYTTNSAKVVFLKSRPQTKACRNLTNNCITCERGLQDPYLFCSISCKIHHIMTSEELMSQYLHECEVVTPQELSSDEWLMTPDSDIEPLEKFVSLTTSSSVNRRKKGMPRRSPFI